MRRRRSAAPPEPKSAAPPEPKSAAPPERPKWRDWLPIATLVAAILPGIAALAAVIFTFQSTNSQLRIAEQGQITDRYTKAIEQLGAIDTSSNPKMELRLGAIYALERIARDSERDQLAVV